MSPTPKTTKHSAEAISTISALAVKATSSRPVLKSQRSLQEKVLSKTATARSSFSEDSESHLRTEQAVAQKIETWDAI